MAMAPRRILGVADNSLAHFERCQRLLGGHWALPMVPRRSLVWPAVPRRRCYNSGIGIHTCEALLALTFSQLSPQKCCTIIFFSYLWALLTAPRRIITLILVDADGSSAERDVLQPEVGRETKRTASIAKTEGVAAGAPRFGVFISVSAGLSSNNLCGADERYEDGLIPFRRRNWIRRGCRGGDVRTDSVAL